MDIKIFTGIPIYTQIDDEPVVEAIVVSEGKIIFKGNMEEAKKRYSNAKVIKFAEGIILPGFIDPHIDLAHFSGIYRDLDLSGIKTKEEIIKVISEFVRNKKEKRWLVAAGLDYKIVENITRKDLDKAAPFNPVLIYLVGFHTAIANTRALEISSIGHSYQNPMGGVIERDGNGDVTGILKDRAIEIVAKFIDSMDSRRTIKSLKSGIEKILSIGITTFCDFSSNSTNSHVKQLMQIYRNDEIKGRIVLMLDERDAEFISRVGIISKFGSNTLILGGAMLIIDGSIPSITAFMKRPYLKTRSNGVLLYSEEEVYRLVREFQKSYLWTSIQATGDAANDIALRVYEKLNKEKAIPTVIKRIDYAEALNDDDIDRFAKNDIIPVLTPAHIPLIRKKAIDLLSSNARILFRIGSLIKSGVKVAFASDAPVVYPDPIYAIYCAVERKDYKDGPELRFYPREHINIKEAVKAVTINAAYACGMGDKVGSLDVGKQADMVQLSKDIFNCKIDELINVKVVKTFVDGEEVDEK